MNTTSSIGAGGSEWRFVSNHGVVLLAIARNPDVRIHEVASTVGVTERACQKIINDLKASGYLSARRVGRRNVYAVDRTLPMRHPALRTFQVARLLDLWEGTVHLPDAQDGDKSTR